MKMLFSSGNCLLDTSSGAAISVVTFLQTLAKSGIESRSFTASTYDRPLSLVAAENLRAAGADKVTAEGPWRYLWLKDHAGVKHFVVPTRVPGRMFLTAAEEMRVYHRFLTFIEDYRPDAFMMYGSGLLELALLRAARELGSATFFYLANPTYKRPGAFKDIDQVFTDTAATRDLYAETLGLSAFAIGKFVEKPRVPAGAESRFVTFINPAAEKGVTLFFRIVQLSQKFMPEVQFLVVESRATLEAAERRSGMHFSSFKNVKRVGLQKDMGAVFGQTRVLIVPSVWHESGGRVAIEACSLGIPAIVSGRGGLQEVMGEAGIEIPPPPPLIKNHWLIPPESEAIPWVEMIRELMTDDAFYQAQRQAALERWKAHDPAARIGEIIDVIRRTVARRSAQ